MMTFIYLYHISIGAPQLSGIVISTITQHWLSDVLQGIECRKSVAARVILLSSFLFGLAYGM